MTAYYNEFDPFAAAWLRELIKEGLIADGEVDERSITDVGPGDLDGFTQCHFFAGIGGWSYALRLAGWPDDRPVWTGSCPCQPFSLAGAQKGFNDSRHLWPEFKRLIAERRPPVVFGEQVASAAAWLGLVRGDLEALEYAVGAMPIQAASAGADHLRDRFWFVGHDTRDGRGEGRPEHEVRIGSGSAAAIPSSPINLGAGEERQQRSGQQRGAGGDQEPCAGDVADPDKQRLQASGEGGDSGIRLGLRSAGHSEAPQSASGSVNWVIGADGKARRVKPGVRLLAHGFPGRVGLLRGFGNAIDPRPAAAFIKAAAGALT